MGAFYGNITLKGPSQGAVGKALRGRRAVVAPTIGDLTVAFDSACDDQDTDAIQALASRLSTELNGVALAVIVHDDDVLAYFLFHAGELVDWYNSCPSYFDFGAGTEPAGPSGGNAERLCTAFGVGSRVEVDRILRKPRGDGGYDFETQRHKNLVQVLELPAFAVGTALASFERGEYPVGLSVDRMMWAADPPPVEDPQLRWDREFYDRLGPEDSSRQCRRDGCSRGAIAIGVLCKRHHFEMVQRRGCPFDA